MSRALGLYQRSSKFPLGHSVFSNVLILRAPYFASIHPLIVDLRPGYCEARVKDRRSIRNHIGSVHAGAMCTLSELVGGLAVEVSIPLNLRWIPKEMTVRYLKKARGTLTGICSFEPASLVPGDVSLPLEIQDEAGDTVLRATILFYVSERLEG
jgi:acyl-coenzyme A thioesterase PaaI-like protein